MSSTQNRSQLARGRRPLGCALVCDLVGFTPLTERLDPETVERVQRDYFDLMRAIVEEHGGGMEEGSMYSGDAVIALFDVSEDHAERAVRAAASMCEALVTLSDAFRAELERPLEVRVGVAESLDAAVLQQSLASPGEIVVSGPTWQQTRHAFRYEKRTRRTAAGPVGGYAYAGGVDGAAPIRPRSEDATRDPTDRRMVTAIFFEESAAYERVRTLVEQHGGQIEKISMFSGDAIFAVFGATQAQEDHPERAVRAALAVRDELGVRAGVATGEVVVRPEGAGPAVGDALNTAARLLSTGTPSEIAVSHATWLRTSRAFRYGKPRRRNLKGKRETANVYPCLEALPEPRPDRSSRFVGREREVAALDAALGALDDGRGGVVQITGPAGIGKSRLVAEARSRANAERILWLETRAVLYGDSLSYLPFIRLLRSWAGIASSDDEATSFAKLERLLTEVLLDEVDQTLPFFGRLLGLELPAGLAGRVRLLSDEAFGRQTLRAWRRLFTRLAGRQPLVLVCEDWHWADTSSADLLGHLLPLTASTRLLVICTSRSGEPAEGLAPVLPHAAAIELAPFSAEESSVLAREVLGEQPPQSFLRATFAQTGGNPFFIEEVARLAVQTGDHLRPPPLGTARSTPGTVRDVVAARVDRLDEPTIRLARAAAVAGRSVAYPLLRRLEPRDGFDEALSALVSSALVEFRGEGDDRDVVFTHDVIREAVYEGILKGERKRLHGEVAAALEELFPSRTAELYSVLAYHWAEAGDARADELLILAGDQASALAGDAEALKHYKLACERLEASYDELRQAELRRKIGAAHYRRGEHQAARAYLVDSLSRLDAAYPTGRRLPPALAAQAMVQAGHRLRPGRRPRPLSDVAIARSRGYEAISWIDYFASGLEMGLDALLQTNVSERHGYVPGLVRGLSGLGFAFDAVGLSRIGGFYHREAVKRIHELDDPPASGLALLGLGAHQHYLTGHWEDALVTGERSSSAYWSVRDLRGWGVAEILMVTLLARRGELAAARLRAERMRDVGAEAADPVVEAWGRLVLGRVLCDQGELDEARRELERSAAGAGEVPDHRARVMALGEHASAAVAAGDIEGALALAFESEQEIRKLRGLRGFARTPSNLGLVEALLANAELQLARNGRLGLRRHVKLYRVCRALRRQARLDCGVRPAALRLDGTRRWLRGRRAAAERRWRQSIAAADALGAPVELERTTRERARRGGSPV